MPIDYKKYHPDWKTKIRPSVLDRAKNCCEMCNVPNKKVIIRGNWNGVACYQDDDGFIYDEKTSQKIGEDYIGEVHPTNKFITIVLTIAHLDHNIENNDLSNLKALCQKCHLNYDKEHHAKNSRETRNKKKGIIDLFNP